MKIEIGVCYDMMMENPEHFAAATRNLDAGIISTIRMSTKEEVIEGIIEALAGEQSVRVKVTKVGPVQ